MNLTPIQTKVLAIIACTLLIPLELLLIGVTISLILRDEPDKVQTTFTMVFVIAIFSLPLRWAYLSLKRLKQKSAPSHTDASIDASTVIRIQTKMDLPQYRKLMYQISYSNSVFIYLHIIGVGIFGSSLFSNTGQWLGYFSLFFLLYLPIAIYRSANTNYKTTKAIHETLSYEFNPETITITGETFNTTMQWTTFHKSREMKNWFLLYTNKQVAMLIPKSAFASPQEINLFREMTKRVQ